MNRKKIADIVRALRAKTVENGCTEGEAAAAAKKIAQLLEQYNMTLDEAELRESDFTKANHPQDDLIGKVIYRVASAISHMMDIKFWSERPGEPRSTTFFGFTHEVDIGTLADVAARHELPLAWDLGSGALLDGSRHGLPSEHLPAVYFFFEA